MKQISKRLLGAFLAFVIIFGSAPLSGFVGLDLKLPDWLNFDWLKTEASAKTSGIYQYKILNREVTITGCTSTASGAITIPSKIEDCTVTSIGYGAFQYCVNITSISIPNSVTCIGDYAFIECGGLTCVTLGTGVTTIGLAAFIFCENLTSITVDSGNPSYSSSGGVLFNFEKTQVIQYPRGKTGGYAIPDGVTSIGFGAFAVCTGLTSIFISNSVMRIGDSAFGGCTGLTIIIIPDSVTSIGESVFSDCSSLMSVTIGNSVTSIGERAFSDLSSLMSVTIGSGVMNIGNSAFDECSALTSIYIPNNVTRIGDFAFSSCTSLTSLTIGNGVTSIGEQAFRFCTGLTSIDIPDNVMRIGVDAFDGTAWYNNQPDGLVYAGKVAYRYKGNMPPNTVIVLKSDTKVIGDYVFSECTSLTSVTIGSGVTSIGNFAFSGCSGLISIEIPESVTNIGDYVFNACSALIDIAVKSGNSTYTSENGILFSKDKTKLITCPKGKLGSVFIPVSVTSIGDYAFSYCIGLTNIIIPDSVKSINYRAFDECCGLTNINIPSSVSSIGDWAFCGCTSLTSLDIPTGVSIIGNHTFEACFKLTNITISNTVVIIGDYAFSYCNDLSSISIPGSVSIISEGAFSNCYNLTNVIIGTGVTSIGDSAFFNCHYLTDITIPSSVTSIGEAAFSVCTSLASVDIPAGVSIIGNGAFQSCWNLANITISNTVASIGEHAFYCCSSLTSMTIPASVTSFYNNSFQNCKSLSNINVSSENTVYSSADGILYNKKKTELIFCPEGKIGVVIMPSSVKSINYCAFQYCSGLTSVTIGNSVTSIGYYMFEKCSGLTSIIFESAITIISFDSKTIPAQTKIIGYDPSTAKEYALKFNRSFVMINDGKIGNYEAGDTITFGSYPQTSVIFYPELISMLNECKKSADDTVTYKGEKYKFNDGSWSKFESITWRVLSNTNGELFIMADKILDSKAYNQVQTNVTWETCGMRSWLNNDFYNEAFSTTEKSQILTSDVINNDVENGANNTNDKLFLLSSGEAATSAYGFNSSWGATDLNRMVQGTYYSKSRGLGTCQESPYAGNSLWWLRSPGSFQSNAGYIGQDGIVYSNQYSYTGVSQNSLGVRPALKLKLNSADLILRENFDYNPDECSQKLAERCAEYNISLDDGSIDKKLTQQESSSFSNPFSMPRKYNFYDNVTEDNAGVIFAKKSVIYNNEPRTLTIVIISGTLDVQWKGDMDVSSNEGLSGDPEEHSSFTKAKNDIREKLGEYLQDGANSLLLITGFSRGAGVANLLANELTENKLSGKISDVFAYTFATPNTTNNNIIESFKTNIFNFCFNDDFVTKSLSSWGWDKYGFLFTAVAQDLYQNNDGFKEEMNANIYGRKPGFDKNRTSGVMEYIGSKWKSLESYYNDHYDSDMKSLYNFMRDVVAPAAMETDIKTIEDYYKKISSPFRNIAAYFAEGMDKGIPGFAGTFIKDTHNMDTYYSALKNGGFQIGGGASGSWKTQSIAKTASTDGTTSPTNPNQTELQKLITFVQQGDNLAKLGWDIEDCSTWQGVTWDTETENRICNIDIGFLELSGTLDLADFTSLTNLNCSGNGLTSIVLSGCTSLQVLKCANNLLSALSVEGNTSITSLDCSWNTLETLNIEGCTSLVRLQCNNNELNELTIGTNPALTDLYCVWNNLTAIDFSLNSQLINFSCEENCIDIQSGSAMMTAVEQFTQKSGTWVMFDPQKMPANPVFNTSDITKLTDFANQNGNLSKIKWDLSKPQEWYGVKWMEVNDEYCAERIEVPNLGLVGTLDVSGLANLTLLNCSGNQLSNINVSNCPKLEYLDCRNSKTESLNISSCANLSALNCENNYLDVSEGTVLRGSIDSMSASGSDSVVFEPQRILADASAFNSTEYGVLSAFAQTGDNLTLLGWDLTKPGEWQGVTWVMVNGEYRAEEISMGGLPVTGSIDLTNFSALTKVDFSGTMIISISLPNGMTEIQDWAFYDCSELASINMPDSIVRIGESAFCNCTKLVVNDLPGSLVTIAEKAFYNCTSLTSVTIPDSVSNISMFAFSDCANAANITIPDNVSSISLYAFSGCENLVINCLKGSPAETYAIKNGINYLNPDIKAVIGTNTVVDSINGLIYGLDKSITSLDGLIQTIGGAAFQTVYSNGTVCGTGSTINVLFCGVVAETYKVVIFGDVNGDGVIDTADSDTIVDIGNYALPQWDPETEDAFIKACDLFRDGVIDENDCVVLKDVQNYALTLDQRTGEAT